MFNTYQIGVLLVIDTGFLLFIISMNVTFNIQSCLSTLYAYDRPITDLTYEALEFKVGLNCSVEGFYDHLVSFKLEMSHQIFGNLCVYK